MTDLFARFQTQLKQSEASNRSFGFMMSAACMVLGFVRMLRGGGVRWEWAGLAGVLLLLTLFAPSSLTYPKRAWLLLGFLMGLVVNPIVLGIVFFLVITPAGILLRLFRHDPLRLRPVSGHTYWCQRDEDQPDMTAQF